MNSLLLAILFLAGWLNANHFSPWVSWHSEVPFFLWVLLVASNLAARSVSKGSIQISVPLLLPVLLGLVLAAQGVSGLIDSHGQVFVVALYLLAMATSIAWGWDQAQSGMDGGEARRHLAGDGLAWVLIAGGVLSLAIAMAQVLQLWEGWSVIARQAYIRRPGGNLAQPNHLATLLVMGMGAALFLYAQRRVGRAVLVMLVWVFSLGVAITESRSGLLATLLLWALWFWKRPTTTVVTRSRMWALGAVLVAIVLFALWPNFYRWYAGGVDIGDAGLERFESTGGDPRWVLWQQMVQASLLKPWLGWGIRNTAEAHNAIAHEGVATLNVTYSHNILLDMAIWVGWPLALGIATLVGMWVWCRLKVVSEQPLAWFGMALLLPFGVHSFFEFPFAYTYLLVPAMLGVGFVEGALRCKTLAWRAPRWMLVPLVSLFCLLGLWSVVDYVRVEEDFRVARFQMLRIGPPPTELPPQIVLLDQLGDMVASTRVPLQAGLGAAQMGLLRKSALNYPWSGSQYRYAVALALHGERDEARRQMLVLRAQQGFKAYRILAAQLERDLAQRGLPTLGLPLEKPL